LWTTYEGEFEDGKIHGYGVLKYLDGGSEEGTFVKGDLQGFGVTYFSREDYRDFYKGEFKDSKMHGKGELRWKNGDRMVGEWVEGLRHGDATLYWTDGCRWTGQFVNDQREGPGHVVDTRFGYTFEGNYCNDRRTDGVIRWLNGDSWVGRYFSENREEEDKREENLSEGMMTFANGNTLKGQWLNDSMKNGRGEMVIWLKEDNREVKGEWIDGRFQPTESS